MTSNPRYPAYALNALIGEANSIATFGAYAEIAVDCVLQISAPKYPSLCINAPLVPAYAQRAVLSVYKNAA